MGVLGINPAEVALELPHFCLKPFRQGGGYGKYFLQAYLVIVKRDVRIQIEVGVDRRKDEKLAAILGWTEIEPIARVLAKGGETRYAAVRQLAVAQARGIDKRIEQQGDVRIGEGAAAEKAAHL